MTVNVRRKRRYTILSRTAAEGRRIIVRGGGRRLYTLLSLITLSGVIIGAVGCTSSAHIAEEISAHSAEGGFVRIFLDSFAAAAVYIMLCFFGGLSSAGAPLGYLLCLFKGMGTGALCASIFSGGTSNMPLKSAADILPFSAMSIALLIFSARENIRMATVTRKRTFEETPANVHRNKDADFGLYLKKFGIIILAAIGAAVIDGIIGVLINI